MNTTHSITDEQDLHYQSATELISALANKEISSAELLEKSIARIEQLDKKINAVVVRDFDSARKAAIAADKAIARGERRPLLGLPITVKESFGVKGLIKSWGMPKFKDQVSETDALTVARLKAAGAIIIGKTNVPFMLKDWQTYNDIYGTTNNPYDITLTPGGSSGGAAAALAAGFVPLELGSDMAGSLRTPAHYCGVFAHRPTLNLIPMRGAEPPNISPSSKPINDFSVVGPMARTAEDLLLSLNILAGPDEQFNGKGYTLSLPKARHNKLSDYRVLVIDTHPLCPTSHSVKQSIDNLVTQLIKLNVNVSRKTDHAPCLKQIAQTYATLLTATVGGTMPLQAYEEKKALAQELANDDDSFESYFLRGFALTHRDWLKQTRIRQQLCQQWRNLYKGFDVILFPTMPTPAFTHDHNVLMAERKINIDGAAVPYAYQHVWPSIASLFGLPVTAAPINPSEKGLPIGIQIIGDHLEDHTTLMFAKLIERECGGFMKPQ